MIRKSIYGPARLLNIPNLSETVVEALEKNKPQKPADPVKLKVKQLIADLLTSRPDLINAYRWDELKTEEVILSYLKGYELTATINDIAEVIYPKVCERYGAEA